jgi:hypothetical protein
MNEFLLQATKLARAACSPGPKLSVLVKFDPIHKKYV